MTVTVTELELPVDAERAEILEGLRKTPKRVSPKFFYDERGSRLFDAICEQPEYYPTRTELAIMEDHVDAMADLIGPRAMLIEYGSGSSLKTRLLLEHLTTPAAYVPVDISGDYLQSVAETLASDFPDIEVLPVCADFTRAITFPAPRLSASRNVVYFPGSTIGNFARSEARELLRVMRAEAGDEGAVLIGVDLAKPREVLEPAYNDAAGVTADFNLNLLRRLNREHDADFDLDAFRHEAVYDADESRIEMRLVSVRPQSVSVAGERFRFEADEYVVTEHSHKYSPDQFAELAGDAGLDVQRVWTDPEELFSVQYLTAA